MIGSRPVVGSSKKMTSGSAAMARARPTRFCMPPESSAGDKAPTSGPSPTCANLVMAMSLASSRAILRPWIKPKATFSQTVRLSNRAAPWNSMPKWRSIASRSLADCSMVSLPSTRIDPSSGVKMPRMHFSITDLPVPEPPMMTTDSPRGTSRFKPFNTCLGPKDLWTPFRSMWIGVFGASTGVGASTGAGAGTAACTGAAGGGGGTGLRGGGGILRGVSVFMATTL